MRSQFDPSLKIDSNGNVEAAGEFSWETDEEKAVVEVAMFQELGGGNLAKTGSGKGVFLKSSNPSKWNVLVESEPAPNRLSPGEGDPVKTIATGIVCALGKTIEMRQFIWTEQVKLDPQE